MKVRFSKLSSFRYASKARLEHSMLILSHNVHLSTNKFIDLLDDANQKLINELQHK